jgi:hypothetical protein
MRSSSSSSSKQAAAAAAARDSGQPAGPPGRSVLLLIQGSLDWVQSEVEAARWRDTPAAGLGGALRRQPWPGAMGRNASCSIIESTSFPHGMAEAAPRTARARRIYAGQRRLKYRMVWLPQDSARAATSRCCRRCPPLAPAAGEGASRRVRAGAPGQPLTDFGPPLKHQHCSVARRRPAPACRGVLPAASVAALARPARLRLPPSCRPHTSC